MEDDFKVFISEGEHNREFEKYENNVHYGIACRQADGDFPPCCIYYKSFRGPRRAHIQISHPPVSLQTTLDQHNHEQIIELNSKICIDIWLGASLIYIKDFFENDKIPEAVSIVVTIIESDPI